METRVITRKGDASPIVYVEFSVGCEGIKVCVHPDTKDIPARETIRICAANAGGRSPAMYQALVHIEHRLIREGQIGPPCILTGKDGRIVFLRGTGDSDFVMKTDNLAPTGGCEFCGATVLFETSDVDYELVAYLLNAVKKDNTDHPIV